MSVPVWVCVRMCFWMPACVCAVDALCLLPRSEVYFWGRSFGTQQVTPPACVGVAVFLKIFFLALLIEHLKTWQETDWERGGVTRSNRPQTRTRTRVHCSEAEASVHGMPALPSELNGTWVWLFLFVFYICISAYRCLQCMDAWMCVYRLSQLTVTCSCLTHCPPTSDSVNWKIPEILWVFKSQTVRLY